MQIRGFTEEMRKKPICGLVALAVCANVSIQEAERVARKTFTGKRFTGSTNDEQLRTCLTMLGVRFKTLVPERKMNLKNWLNRYARSGVTYMIFVSRHVITVRDGIITDQGMTAPLGEHWCSRKFVQEAMEIL